jgi:adenosine/AMP kinase
MELSLVPIEKPGDMNFILGHSHFIKTVEDLYEAIVQTNPAMKFGLAFCEASGPALVRYAGNDQNLIELAQKNAMNIRAGHTFLIMMESGFPISILNTVKQVPEVCRVFCATANPTQVVIAESDQGRAVLGVVDGFPTRDIETEQDIRNRHALLRDFGYKL